MLIVDGQSLAYYALIMLEDSKLCSMPMLYPTNYAKNYAGIMGAGLAMELSSSYRLQYGAQPLHNQIQTAQLPMESLHNQLQS